MESLNLNVNIENLSDNERKTLMSLIEKASKSESKVWKPEENGGFWYITLDGKTLFARWDGGPCQQGMWEYGNIFKTKEEATYLAERKKIQTKLLRLSQESYEPNGSECVAIMTQYSKAAGRQVKFLKGESAHAATFRFKSESDAKAAIKEVGEREFLEHFCVHWED